MVSEPEFKRAYWASRRGMLELDLILVPFCEQRFRGLDEVSLARYWKLLECEDTELFAWFLRRGRPDDVELRAIVDDILEFTHRTQD